MRLDKYLKISRIIKRRTFANDACDTEHVSVNGKRAKASYDVKVGDIIEIIRIAVIRFFPGKPPVRLKKLFCLHPPVRHQPVAVSAGDTVTPGFEYQKSCLAV